MGGRTRAKPRDCRCGSQDVRGIFARSLRHTMDLRTGTVRVVLTHALLQWLFVVARFGALGVHYCGGLHESPSGYSTLNRLTWPVRRISARDRRRCFLARICSQSFYHTLSETDSAPSAPCRHSRSKGGLRRGCRSGWEQMSSDSIFDPLCEERTDYSEIYLRRSSWPVCSLSTFNCGISLRKYDKRHNGHCYETKHLN